MHTANTPRKPPRRPFRFGASLFCAGSAREWADKAQRAEALGYDTFSIPDHLMNGLFSPMAALCSAAEATTRLRVGTLVLNNDLRHPALVARDAATLDVLRAPEWATQSIASTWTGVLAAYVLS